MATIAITAQCGRLGSVSETSPQGEDGHVPAVIIDGRPQSPDTPTAIPLQEQQSAKQPSAPPYLKQQADAADAARDRVDAEAHAAQQQRPRRRRRRRRRAAAAAGYRRAISW